MLASKLVLRIGTLGGTNLTNNPAGGLLPGYGNAAGYGAFTNATFDPRQIMMQARVIF